MTKKAKKNKKTNNTTKKFIMFFIVIVLIVLVITFIINNKGSKQKDSDKVNSLDFEKVAIYKYVQEKFLNNNLLQDLVNTSEITNEENGKICYSIGYVMLNNNSKTASLNEVEEAYNKIFGEKPNELESNPNFSTYMYTYDETKQLYKLSDENLENNTRVNKIFITDFEQNDEENIIKIEILEPKEIDDFIMYYNSDNINIETLAQLRKIRDDNLKNIEKQKENPQTKQFLNSLITEDNKDELTRKVATGELKLKVYNNDYIIQSYTQQEEL